MRQEEAAAQVLLLALGLGLARILGLATKLRSLVVRFKDREERDRGQDHSETRIS